MQGAAITAAREARGLTRADLASAMRVSERTIYRWEAEEVVIPPNTRIVLEQKLGNPPATKKRTTTVNR